MYRQCVHYWFTIVYELSFICINSNYVLCIVDDRNAKNPRNERMFEGFLFSYESSVNTALLACVA